jgi:hypothetical protein
MEGDYRRSRTRSFLVGVAIGASAALAAARGLRKERRQTPAGLAAFEDAPCYRELVERERGGP